MELDGQELAQELTGLLLGSDVFTSTLRLEVIMNTFCEGGWLKIWDSAVAAGKLARLHLFKNNHTPLYTDTAADYTEADFSGYGAYQALAWGSAFVNGSNEGEIDATALTWTHNGGGTANTVYGVYITDGANALMYAERFAAPVSMSANGDKITYTAKSTMINQ